eukprot:5435116-Heterocapsa_arctica.AAC.1
MPLRHMVTAAEQLKALIDRSLASNHGPPMNRTQWNSAEQQWEVHWKWGTVSAWPVTEDEHT